MTLRAFGLGPALDRVRDVLVENEPIHGDRWRRQSVAEHVHHAVEHLHAYEAGGRSEDHLGHAATRCLMALMRASEGEGR